MIKQNEEYHGINDMFNWQNRINKTSPYFMSLGDFLRDTYKMEEIK